MEMGDTRHAVASAAAAEICDIDELVSVQPGWELRYEQLSRGQFRGAVELVQWAGLSMVRESASQATRQRGQIGAGNLGLAMFRAPAGFGYFHGRKVQGDCIMIGRGDELDLLLQEGYELRALVVSQQVLDTLREQLTGDQRPAALDQKLVVNCAPELFNAMRLAHARAMALYSANRAIFDVPQHGMRLRDVLLSQWLRAITESADPVDTRRIAARKRIVDRACELVLSSPDSAWTMLDVCKRIGASPRKLEMCFQDVLGMSPHKYLRTARLNGARREIKRLYSTDSIHDVAARWGFWHMSAFSAEYKRQFGEAPSATRTRFAGFGAVGGCALASADRLADGKRGTLARVQTNER